MKNKIHTEYRHNTSSIPEEVNVLSEDPRQAFGKIEKGSFYKTKDMNGEIHSRCSKYLMQTRGQRCKGSQQYSCLAFFA